MLRSRASIAKSRQSVATFYDHLMPKSYSKNITAWTPYIYPFIYTSNLFHDVIPFPVDNAFVLEIYPYNFGKFVEAVLL